MIKPPPQISLTYCIYITTLSMSLILHAFGVLLIELPSAQGILFDWHAHNTFCLAR